MTVKELVYTIQTQTGYSFAFSNSVLDVSKTIQTGAKDYALNEVLKLLMEQTNCQYAFKKRFIIITPSLKKEEPEPIRDVALNDTYIPSDGRSIDKEHPEFPFYSLPDSIILEEHIIYELPELEWKEPYTIFDNPEVYQVIKSKLPRYALSVNALQLATLTPNISVEAALSAHTTVALSASCFPWKKSGKREQDKFSYQMLRAEYKYWFNERFNGHYVGGHLVYAGYDVKGYRVPLLAKKNIGYKGHVYGAGISYGYHLPLSTQWGIEFSAGVGVARFFYDKYTHGVLLKKRTNYVGPTQLGLRIVYLLK